MSIFKSKDKYSLFSRFFSYIEGTLFNSSLKKYKKYKQFEFPETINLGPTNYCNHSCIMCPNKEIDKKSKGFMSLEIFEKIFLEMKKNKKYLKRVTFGLFGEPTMHPKIKYMLKKSKDEGFKVVIGSNASNLNKDFIDFIIENKIDEVRLSFYSTSAKNYSIIQGHPSKFYKSTLNNINYLIERSRNSSTFVFINFISMKYNSQNWQKYFKQFKKSENLIKGIARLHDWDKINEKRKLKKESIFPLRYFKPCQQIESTIAIDWNGDVKTCCYAWNIPFLKLGNVNENSIHNLFNSDKMKFIKNSHEIGNSVNFVACNNCGAHRFESDFFNSIKFYFIKIKLKRF